MNEVKLSVILPCFNRKALVLKALESLLAQDYTASLWELIVVDNQSTDGTAQAAAEFLNSQTTTLDWKVVIETQKGLVFTRHTGAAHAQHSILLFGDDDALYEPNWVSSVAEVYQRFPAVGAVGTRILIRWDSPPPAWVRPLEYLHGRITMGNGITIKDEGMFINGGSFSIRKEILRHVEGFNPGQLGDYLLGDSETGLCRKLHALNIPIGFTDRTTMWHLQFANRHATEADIARRFANNGIADAYNAYFNDKNPNKSTVESELKRIPLRILKARVLFRRADYRYNAFRQAYLKSYLTYLNLYSGDAQLAQAMQQSTWKFNTNYHAAPVAYEKKHA